MFQKEYYKFLQERILSGQREPNQHLRGLLARNLQSLAHYCLQGKHRLAFAVESRCRSVALLGDRYPSLSFSDKTGT